MKKILILILSTLLLANCVMFAGCKNNNPIPSGYYYCVVVGSQYSAEKTESNFYILVDKNKAIEWISGQAYLKFKIKTQGDKIYFKSYEYRQIWDFFTEKHGREFTVEVQYDETTKTLYFLDNFRG